MTLATPTLLDLLRQLLTPEQMRQTEGLAQKTPPVVLLETLAGQGVLTGYQAAEIGAGRGEGLVLGPYVLLEKLGEGGMGEVFRARHRNLDREEALKRLLPARLDSPQLVARFGREVKAAARLSHPNVVQVYHASKAAH